MARHIDSVCKLCRREGVKLYLKATRCETPKCAIERRDQAPGMHTRRGKQSEYGTRLREKQKLKRFYGILERQFRRYFEIASRSTENTGEALLSVLERRLDNIVHRLGWAHSRAAARQIVNHGHILLNGRKCSIPSILVKAGDTIGVKNNPRALQLVKINLGEGQPQIPDYLEQTGNEPPTARVARLPSRTDVDSRIKDINEQLIIEFAGR